MEGATSALLGHKLARPSKAVADGVHAEWSWDGSRLVVCNDRYGFHPLYYFARPGEVCLSPSIPDLVRHGGSPDLDETAFAAFLRLGYFLGEDTPFREIRALPPNARLEWADGELRLSGGYALGKPQSMKGEEAIDAYVSLFRTAIERGPLRSKISPSPSAEGGTADTSSWSCAREDIGLRSASPFVSSSGTLEISRSRRL